MDMVGGDNDDDGDGDGDGEEIEAIDVGEASSEGEASPEGEASAGGEAASEGEASSEGETTEDDSSDSEDEPAMPIPPRGFGGKTRGSKNRKTNEEYLKEQSGYVLDKFLLKIRRSIKTDERQEAGKKKGRPKTDGYSIDANGGGGGAG